MADGPEQREAEHQEQSARSLARYYPGSEEPDPSKCVIYDHAGLMPAWLSVSFTTVGGELHEIVYVSSYDTQMNAKRDAYQGFVTEIDGHKLSIEAQGRLGDAVAAELKRRASERQALLEQRRSELAELL